VPAVTVARSGAGRVQHAPQGGLAEVLDLVLDKGLVIDAFIKVSLVGIEILTIDARVVVASVDTYLRFAEATNRLDLHAKGGKGLPDLLAGGGRAAAEGATYRAAKSKTSGVLEAGKEKWDEIRGKDQQRAPQRRRR
jgi:hypothetical protein